MRQVTGGMAAASGGRSVRTGAEGLTAELEAYNRAFAELELPWRWDADTFRQLLSVAGESDCVGAYIERNQAHLLRVYEKTFLRDLVLEARDRCRADASS
jgi:hypothetical protein